MMKKFQLIQIAVVALVLLGIFGCSPSQDRYEDPPWLGGSSIETLEKAENYTVFLKLMEKAGQKTTIEKTLATLFAPNDSAFNIYFQSIGKSSVDELTEEEATQLFTLHVLPNPRSRFQLLYEYLYKELQGPDGEYATLFFRKPTKSTSIPYKEVVPEFYADARLRGQELTIYTDIKLIPLFSTEYFEDFFGDPKGSDYEFMYRQSKWSKHGLNWGNAAVTASEVRTSNGFIYYLDQVVPPQESIEEYLRKNTDKYGLYYSLMQRFANYGSTRTVNGLTQYKKSYEMISNIAEEQGPFTGNEARMKDMFTAYLPNNQLLQAYLDKTVLKTYASLDSVPKVTLYYILQTHLARSLGLISKISQTNFNSFGDPMIITKDDILDAHMASNGLIYEMKKVYEPNVFTCVPGNLFFNANYSTFLYALDKSGVFNLLSDPDTDVTLFAPTNEQLYAYGIRYEPISQAIMYRGKDGKWTSMKAQDLSMFVKDHIYEGRLDNLTEERYVEMSSKNFIRIKDGAIQAAENQQIGEFVNMAETIPNERNGILYNVATPIKTNYGLGKFIVEDPELSQFKDMLVSAGYLVPKAVDPVTRDIIPNLKFLAEGDYWTGLIPTNAAMDAARAANLIPTEKEAIKKFLLGHFIRRNVIFDDGKLNGFFPTNRLDGTVYVNVKITNTLNNMTVEDHTGQVITIDHAKANYLVRKGVIHKIDSVLKYQ